MSGFINQLLTHYLLPCKNAKVNTSCGRAADSPIAGYAYSQHCLNSLRKGCFGFSGQSFLWLLLDGGCSCLLRDSCTCIICPSCFCCGILFLSIDVLIPEKKTGCSHA